MRRKLSHKIMITAGAVLMLVFCIGPFVYMAAVALAESPDFLLPDAAFNFTFENFVKIITDDSLHFLDYLRNSLLISLISSLVCIFIAALTAYAITRMPLPGKNIFFFMVLAVSLFPQIGLVGYLFKLMTKLGWINTYPGLIMPYIAWTLPLSLWILTSYFSSIPVDLEEAALVDGCSRIMILVKITLPLALPGLFSVLLLAFIFAFNEFMFALMLTTDYHSRTIPVGIAMFQGLHGQIPWPNIMAASIVTTLPIVVITLIFQRHIISGLTKGAVKG